MRTLNSFDDIDEVIGYYKTRIDKGEDLTLEAKIILKEAEATKAELKVQKIKRANQRLTKPQWEKVKQIYKENDLGKPPEAASLEVTLMMQEFQKKN